RRAEGGRWRVLQCGDHKVAEDRRRDMAAGLVVTKTVRIVEADIYARRKVGCEPDEPRVAPVVGRPRLARDRLADGLDHLGRAPLHHALQHRHNLEGRPGIGYLLTRV